MKYFVKMFLCALVMASPLLMVSCKKEGQGAGQIAKMVIPEDVEKKIKAQGFSTRNISKVTGGYVVEGNIFLSEAALNEGTFSPARRTAQGE
ncbi:hypothetical protein [Chitinophaga nivalis]|uniref:Uncharacterized protein n=1 Tax=Chitinophaga nivalis TaxID=2991709 RepID=A0ABT3INC6_9BACT|nr:hypothetical protein [Chitinophaga nivalis]MCW3464903.1 hypothetical protein [Chitinophaga nivalis]MCW3485406.1 hypothetical protein [Chitinophaga nivalis]